jgi:hypothetical protein
MSGTWSVAIYAAKASPEGNDLWDAIVARLIYEIELYLQFWSV